MLPPPPPPLTAAANPVEFAGVESMELRVRELVEGVGRAGSRLSGRGMATGRGSGDGEL